MTWKCYAEANLATVHWHKKHNIKYSFFPQSCNRNELKLTSCQSCRDFQIVLGYLCIKDVNSLSMFISCWRISKKLFSKDVNDIFARSGSYCLFNTTACIDINSALICVIRNAIKSFRNQLCHDWIMLRGAFCLQSQWSWERGMLDYPLSVSSSFSLKQLQEFWSDFDDMLWCMHFCGW